MKKLESGQVLTDDDSGAKLTVVAVSESGKNALLIRENGSGSIAGSFNNVALNLTGAGAEVSLTGLSAASGKLGLGREFVLVSDWKPWSSDNTPGSQASQDDEVNELVEIARGWTPPEAHT